MGLVFVGWVRTYSNQIQTKNVHKMYSKMQSPFLRDFMKMRAQLVHEVQSPVVERDRKGRKKSKHGTASGAPAFGDVSLASLISEKPSKKEVLDYFRNRIASLVSEDLEMQV